MDIKRIDVSRFEINTDVPNLRRDIHVFVDYVRNREVKRSHRGNMLSKADAKRLAKLMSDPESAAEVEQDGSSSWICFVDDVVRELGFVKYDLQGEYAGYTSYEPSFPDNYIEFVSKTYRQFTAATSARQETMLLDLFLRSSQGNHSEFYVRSPVGRLDTFSNRGSATGVMPALDFAAVRRFLLERLAECPSGEWLSTASLIDYLKSHHRYFLVPRKPTFKNKWEADSGRYGNFYESKEAWGSEVNIAETAEDAFERVEGRYVERFLEGIPLILNYVDVAYTSRRAKAVHPSLGCLPAFRVNERLQRALRGEIAQPRVVVTPNFEVYVEAEAYPAGVLTELAPLCELISEGTSTLLKIAKQKVAASRAADPRFDPVAVLRRIATTDLPANVARELADWTEHGERFVLYSGYTVLESATELEVADRFTVEQIAPGTRIVHSPDKLYQALEQHELMPLRIKHADADFTPLPRNARTQFPKTSASREKKRVEKPSVTLTRTARVQLVCTDAAFLARLRKMLAESNCPFDVDEVNLTLAYSATYEPRVSEALRTLKKEYRVEVKDAG